MIAEALCCIWFVPIDVVKERLQVQKAPLFHASFDRNVYNNSVDAVKKIVKYEGIGGIYKGYFVTLLSFGPFSACYFLFYEMVRYRFFHFLGGVFSVLIIAFILLIINWF